MPKSNFKRKAHIKAKARHESKRRQHREVKRSRPSHKGRLDMFGLPQGQSPRMRRRQSVIARFAKAVSKPAKKFRTK